MKNEIADAAIRGLIDAMRADAKAANEMIEVASCDLDEGRRNGAIGALAVLDETIERLAASLSAARAIHRAAR